MHVPYSENAGCHSDHAESSTDALVGAIAAPFVVERMSDHGFRQWTRGIIFTIAVIYLIRGGILLWLGA